MIIDTELQSGGWTVPKVTAENAIRKYSTTGDVLAFKRCKRQYGYFGVRGFSSATATQLYFGTLVHDVLDRINRDYRLGTPIPALETEIKDLVSDAHDRLIRSGVKPYNSRQQQELATKLIYRFVLMIGPHFFPNVKETEYRLERALQSPSGIDYVLDGVVDVLSGAVSHELGFPNTSPDDIEIWDYKSGRAPDATSDFIRDYTYQMRVYSELYRLQTGSFPARAVLVFVGELGDDDAWNKASLDPTKFPKLILPVEPDQSTVAAAVSDFHNTIDLIEIERSKPYSDQWLPPTHNVDEQTCEACELRYNCCKFKQAAAQRAEPL